MLYGKFPKSVENLGILEVEGIFEVTELGLLQSPTLLDKSSMNCLSVFAYEFLVPGNVLPLNTTHPTSGQF